MSLFSSLFPHDDVLRLGLPPQEEALGLVWIRRERAKTADALLDIAAAWIEERVDDPFRARLRRALAEDSVGVHVASRSETPMPPADALRQFSEPGWEERLAETTAIVAVKAIADPSWPPVAASLALICASGFAADTQGLVMDPAIPRFIPRAGGSERWSGDGRYVLADHLAVSFSPERSGRGWLTTLGLSRFSLPEVEIRNVPEDLGSRAAWLARAVAQRLVSAAIAAPLDDEDEMRLLEMDPELALRPRDVAAARGEEDDGAPSFARPVLVRLKFRNSRNGLGFLALTPGGEGPTQPQEWLRHAVEALVPPDEDQDGSPGADGS